MSALTLRFSTQAQTDIRRMTQEMSDLQRQVASGSKANDLRGLGSAADQLISAQGLKAAADARASTLNQLDARFSVQAAALNQASGSAERLAQSIREAISASDGRGISTELNLAFSSAVSALNETWNGQPMFAGERLGGPPIKVSTLQELQAATTPDDIFYEGARHQVVDLGAGAPIGLANKASELSAGLFETMRGLQGIIDAAGGEIGAPITGAQRDQLLAIVGQLADEARGLTNAEGRAGQLQTRFAAERVRLQERSNLLLKEIGEQADADIAEVSVHLNMLLVQYEASAKIFADLSKLTLLNYL